MRKVLLLFLLLLASCSSSPPAPEDACGPAAGKHDGNDLIDACSKRIEATLGEERAKAYAGRAHALVRYRSDAKAALADYNSALKIAPSFPEALRGRFYVRFFLLRDLPGALEDSTAMLRLDPQAAGGHARQGRVLYCAGRFAEAAKELESSLSADGPDFQQSESMLWLAITRARLRDRNTLTELKKNAERVKNDSADRPAVDLYLGKLGAEAMLKETDRRSPLRCGSRLYAGDWYELHGKPARARELWAEAREHCPPNAYSRMAAIAELERSSSLSGRK